MLIPRKVKFRKQHHPGPVPLLPADPDAGLEVRLWERFFDLYVSGPMQMVWAAYVAW